MEAIFIKLYYNQLLQNPHEKFILGNYKQEATGNEYVINFNSDFEKETGNKIMLEREKTLPIGTFKIATK